MNNKSVNLVMENLTTYSNPKQRYSNSLGWLTDYEHRIGNLLVVDGIIKDYTKNTYQYDNVFSVKGTISIDGKQISYNMLSKKSVELSFRYILKHENVKMNFVLKIKMKNQKRINAIINAIDNGETFDFCGEFSITKPTRKNGKTFSCKSDMNESHIKNLSLSKLVKEEEKAIIEAHIKKATKMAEIRTKREALKKAIYNSNHAKLFQGYESLGFCEFGTILEAYVDCHNMDYDEDEFSYDFAKSQFSSILDYDDVF